MRPGNAVVRLFGRVRGLHAVPKKRRWERLTERGLSESRAEIRKTGRVFTVRTGEVPALAEILAEAAERRDKLERTVATAVPENDSHRTHYARG